VVALVLLAICATAGTTATQAQVNIGAEIEALKQQAESLEQAGRYAEATETAKRALALAEKQFGSDSQEVGWIVHGLAMLYLKQGNNDEAAHLLKRSMDIDQKTLHHWKRFKTHSQAQRSTEKLQKETEIAKRSLAQSEKALPAGHIDIARSLDNLASLYHAQGRLGEAEALFRRSLSIREKALGPDHPDNGTAINGLAILCDTEGRYAEAESLYRRVVEIAQKAAREKALPRSYPDVARTLNKLAGLYYAQHRYSEAEPLFENLLSFREKTLGPDTHETGAALNNLAAVYKAQGRNKEAEPLYTRALAIAEKTLPEGHPDIATSLDNLASLYRAQNRYAEAESLLKRSLSIRENALPKDDPNIATSLDNLASLYDHEQRYAEAEPLCRRALDINRALLSNSAPVALCAIELGHAYFAERDWSRAAEFWRNSANIIAHRPDRDSDDQGMPATGAGQRLLILSLVKAMYRLATEGNTTESGSGPGKAPLNEIFETAQSAETSEAGRAMAQMASRGAKGIPELAKLLRERQDRVAQSHATEKLLTAAEREKPSERDAEDEKALSDRLAAIKARIAEIDKTLAKDFLDYAVLAMNLTVPVGEVQELLGANEALVLFLDTPEVKPTPAETFIWVVTKSDMRGVRSKLGTEALAREVAALRCGLDAVLWYDDDATTRCRGLVTGEPQRDASYNVRVETLPFDFARAHALYDALFDQVEDLLRGKHLLIVPSGPLTQLPFQVLVTAKSNDEDYKKTAWLSRSHALTVLPAVSSLKALRRVAKPSVATKPMIGFGNPLLDGNPRERPWEAHWAQMALDKQACGGLAPVLQVAEAARKTNGVLRVVMRGGRADPQVLKSLVPLPDTADELCAAAKAFKLSAEDIWLGSRATEANIKDLSAKGRLATYRVLHFATHGALAGEITGESEPGLILTPPKDPSDLDDGYLSATEVAALKLDADWVILSACNTAAGGAQGAEALSGLARAFLYAGARALLVSHWEVNSAATVELIVSAVGSITRDANAGRAEALRRAMLTMIDGTEPMHAHPAFWAPFIVVGEGAAR
jgi:CHAT domain-containing protein/tetratricopeptide (TPR) repeat protein